MYKFLIRPLLFLFEAEKVHHFSFTLIRILSVLGIGRLVRKYYFMRHPALQKEVFGLRFENPVGLAAGFDKNAALFNELSDFGFGFIEIGTVTPEPQAGNARPRLFRLRQDHAIINRMGFNNKGVSLAVENLRKSHRVLVGGNIGKNKTTPNNGALDDYLKCLRALYDHVDYFVINVSSPNTPGLRELQEKEPLSELLQALKKESRLLAAARKMREKPILLKISPDLSEEQLLDIIDIIASTGTDGVIATNTTISRSELHGNTLLSKESGGLSGIPLKNRSTEVIRFLAEKSNKAFPIIGVGGIHSPEDAMEKLGAGADLIQLWTGFVYEGPGLVRRINKAILMKENSKPPIS